MTEFAIKLHHWYNSNKRMLPWRVTTDPYKIWLSEVIMQQTQVVQGESYYLKFVENFPTVFDLANATEQKVLKLWQGLGYYSRARNLHVAAKTIVSKYNGVFPDSYKEILGLKGVGPYTAAAISSICFQLPHAVVDGNVYRFISRLKGVFTPIDSAEGKKEFSILANELLDKRNPGEHNQAMMEFGALVCRPSSPVCSDCIFIDECIAYMHSDIASLPVKSKKVKQRTRYFHYFLIQDKAKVYIQKRSGDDIWMNLYQLPLIETTTGGLSEDFEKSHKHKFEFIQQQKHILSHQIIYASFYLAERSLVDSFDYSLIKSEINQLQEYPFSQLVANFLQEKLNVQLD